MLDNLQLCLFAETMGLVRASRAIKFTTKCIDPPYMTTLPAQTGSTKEFKIVNMKAALVLNLQNTDPYTKDLTVLWDSSGFYPCKPTDYKIIKVVE